MSRELKYRVYDKVEKCYCDNAFSIDQFGICYIQDEDGYWEEIDEERYVVEQCTGLKDKNDKYIYDGDIVRYARNLRCNTPPEIRTEIVSWWSGEEEYYPCCTTSGFALPYSEDGYEVIGNIHENPELIGKEK